MSDSSSSAIPAATLIVLRDVPHGPPDLLMLERAGSMTFAAGALVFPGGRVDPGDRLLATGSADGDDDAARIAAVRETLEEAGLAIGLSPVPDGRRTATMQSALHRGAAFDQLLKQAGIALDLSALVPFSRWRPDLPGTRIFDARFYLTRAPDCVASAQVDGTENTRLLWAPAGQVLADADAGLVRLIYPTRRNLERLASYPDYATAATDAGRYPIRTITPFREVRGGQEMLCIPDDLGYPVTAEPLRTVRRG